MNSVLAQIAELVALRRRAPYSGYHCIGEYHGGIYECEYVSPYSKSAHNVTARVMVLLQDWSSHDRLIREPDDEVVQLGHTPSLPTNKNLRRLLRTHFGLELHETYATNLFPFIKSGSLSSRLPSRDLVRAARDFALPQVAAVQPELAICLGMATFNASRSAAGQAQVADVELALKAPFQYGSTLVCFQAHTGSLGQNNRNRGGVDRVARDWQTMSKWIHPRNV